MANPKVSLLGHGEYDPIALHDAVRRLLAPLGGMENFVKPGDRVVLKPNLVFGRPPGAAVNTHPQLVRAAAKLALEAGAAEVLVGDSPGLGTAKAAAKASGILAAVEDLGVAVTEFSPCEVFGRGRTFARLEVARELLEADAVVNLPKLKTHGQMLMSLAVKNMFGAVAGRGKVQWHYRAGRDRLAFAAMLNDVAAAVRPGLSIVDGILGMEGMGPTSGVPRRAGFLAAGDDPWAVDAVILDVLRIRRDSLYTLAAARKAGNALWERAEWTGDDPEALYPGEWNLPETTTLHMHGAFVERHLPFLGRWLRSQFTNRPEANSRCVGCGRCIDLCPAGAIVPAPGGVSINAEACIRCYCCHELCPGGGMDLLPGGWLGSLLGFRVKARKSRAGPEER